MPCSPVDAGPTETVAAVRAAVRLARGLERAADGLGLAHYRVLSAVAEGEDRASRVAERLALGRPSVSVAVDTLCRQGLLDRRAAAGDQRAVDLALTPAGHARLAEVEHRLCAVLDDLCHRSPQGPALREGLASLGPALDALAAERIARRRDGA